MSAPAPPTKKSGYYPPPGELFTWILEKDIEAIKRRLSESESGTAILVLYAMQKLAFRAGGPVIKDCGVGYIATLSSVSEKTAKRRLSDLKRIGIIKITPHRVKTPDGKWINSANTYEMTHFTPGVMVTPPPGVSENDFNDPPLLEQESIEISKDTLKKEVENIAESTPQNVMSTPEIPKAIKDPIQPSKPEKRCGYRPQKSEVAAWAEQFVPGTGQVALEWFANSWDTKWDRNPSATAWRTALEDHLFNIQMKAHQ